MKKVLQERKIISNITSELNEIKELTNSNKEVVVKINSIEKQLLKLN